MTRRSFMGRERGSRIGGFGAGCYAALVLASCGRAQSNAEHATAASLAVAPMTQGSATARAVLSKLRTHVPTGLPTGLADGFDAVPDGLRPHFASGRPAARLRLPDLSLGAVQLEDAGSGATVDVALQDALIVDAETADGYVVYPRAHASGATLLHRAMPDGIEDFLSFDEPPATASVSYKLSLRNGVAGLRMVAGALEMLDASGSPRLRVTPPYIVGAD